MPKEIERKFKVSDGFREGIMESHRIVQGYIAHQNGRTVRVRLVDGIGILTIKGPKDPGNGAISRFEWEKEIPAEEALQLMSLCQGGFIDKTRHLVPFGGHIFEVDEFHGDNEGLVFAELELTSDDEEFERPSWLGEEVSADPRYFNSSLLAYPYKNWK